MERKEVRILLACEQSQVTTSKLINLGFNAFSCDLKKTSGLYPDRHIICDVREIINDNWDLIIAHPPCTYLCRSGSMWLWDKETGLLDIERWEKTKKSCNFFNDIINAKCNHIAVENPIPHRYAVSMIGKYNQLVQPYMFGHPESKATCFWLKNLPRLSINDYTETYKKFLLLPKKKRFKNRYVPPGKNRSEIRSKTYDGIADAMAEQWGEYVFKSKSKS